MRKRTKARFGKQAADERFDLLLKEHRANFPLEKVQIDHTVLDIILVDSHTRKPIGRPTITVAIDLYSRMIVGFYLSFDPPVQIV